jgi:hypothetical protein
MIFSVVPLRIRWRGNRYQESVDLNPADFLAELSRHGALLALCEAVLSPESRQHSYKMRKESEHSTSH